MRAALAALVLLAACGPAGVPTTPADAGPDDVWVEPPDAGRVCPVRHDSGPGHDADDCVCDVDCSMLYVCKYDHGSGYCTRP